MGVAYYPALEPAIDGFAPAVAMDGKTLAKAMPLLDRWATESGLAALESFYSESAEEAFEKIGEPVPPDMAGRPIEWHDPHDGLRMVCGLLDRLKREVNQVLPVEKGRRPVEVRADALRADLVALEAVLLRAAANKSRFRLRIDV